MASNPQRQITGLYDHSSRGLQVSYNNGDEHTIGKMRNKEHKVASIMNGSTESIILYEDGRKFKFKYSSETMHQL